MTVALCLLFGIGVILAADWARLEWNYRRTCREIEQRKLEIARCIWEQEQWERDEL